jgi:hypothetical protein
MPDHSVEPSGELTPRARSPTAEMMSGHTGELDSGLGYGLDPMAGEEEEEIYMPGQDEYTMPQQELAQPFPPEQKGAPFVGQTTLDERKFLGPSTVRVSSN